MMRARPIGLRVVPPAIAQVGPQVLQRTFRMNVAVDNLQLVFGAAVDLRASMFKALPPWVPEATRCPYPIPKGHGRNPQAPGSVSNPLLSMSGLSFPTILPSIAHQNSTMARRKEAHGGGHGWFVTFADLMGLLVSFFVMLVAFSNQDSKTDAGPSPDRCARRSVFSSRTIIPASPKWTDCPHAKSSGIGRTLRLRTRRIDPRPMSTASTSRPHGPSNSPWPRCARRWKICRTSPKRRITSALRRAARVSTSS